MLDPIQTLTRLGGVARGSRLQKLGFTRTELSRLVRAGTIRRIRTGVFAIPELPPALEEAIAHGGAITCGSALRAHGIWVLPGDAALHVWVGAKGRVHDHPGCTCVTHFFSGVPPLGSASIDTALLHLRRCAGDEAFFAAFESAWNQRSLSRAARARIRARLPASARWLVDFARGDAESGLESLLRLRLHILGLHLDCQVRLPGVGRVDFVVAGALILEADGKENHEGAANRHKDLKRDAAASALGYETLHFDYAQIIHDWPTVQAAVLAALHRLGARR
ncbi:DUF559 domain-containing protein [Microbacterium sp. NIBRBAC000506063]|uniref:DUF559 domain-containing protein n=1 Tax=Microbacterium sp. NIBRBAC000506063 TaxID=2734618 RepID=UPI001BB594B3|nr:DUF559 domain-containing protein [Microbacterium sp. NIBRBAC000506063]QTV79880.1 DUF559 domain-containing protein [Microbacterium sp. NIBRBAC000506063]